MDYFLRSSWYLAGREMRGLHCCHCSWPQQGGEHRKCQPWAGVPARPLRLTDPDLSPDKPRGLGLRADTL